MLSVGMGVHGCAHVMLWVGIGGHRCNLKGKCWALVHNYSMTHLNPHQATWALFLIPPKFVSYTNKGHQKDKWCNEIGLHEW